MSHRALIAGGLAIVLVTLPSGCRAENAALTFDDLPLNSYSHFDLCQ